MTDRLRIRVRGKTYPSAAAAARAHGVTVNTVYSALHRGRIDYLGLGKGGPDHNRGGRKPKSIKIGEVYFQSMSEASRALGHTSTYVWQVINRGGNQAKIKLIARAMKYAADRDKAEQKRRQAES